VPFRKKGTASLTERLNIRLAPGEKQQLCGIARDSGLSVSDVVRLRALGRPVVCRTDTLFALHSLRDPGRVSLVQRLPDPLPDVAIPPMLLLPLAENAIKHGVAAGHGGEVLLEVEAARADGNLVVRLNNDGAFAGRRAGGLGLEMVERRLALAYDGRATFRIAAAGAHTIAEISFPLGAIHREGRA
jgi:hypothetical protein